MISPARFNDSMDLETTNPERLLGLTPRECIDLCEASGACGDVLHSLQVRANMAGGGWGEILRSPEAIAWFQWFAGNCLGQDEGISELRALARILHVGSTAIGDAESEGQQRLMVIRDNTISVGTRWYQASVHAARKALLEHLTAQGAEPFDQVQKLDHLSDKLAEAQRWESNQHGKFLTDDEITLILCDEEAPHSAEFLKAARAAHVMRRVGAADAHAYYRNARDERRARTDRRHNLLLRSLAQYLLACTILISPAVKTADTSELVDRLAPED